MQLWSMRSTSSSFVRPSRMDWFPSIAASGSRSKKLTCDARSKALKDGGLGAQPAKHMGKWRDAGSEGGGADGGQAGTSEAGGTGIATAGIGKDQAVATA